MVLRKNYKVFLKMFGAGKTGIDLSQFYGLINEVTDYKRRIFRKQIKRRVDQRMSLIHEEVESAISPYMPKRFSGSSFNRRMAYIYGNEIRGGIIPNNAAEQFIIYAEIGNSGIIEEPYRFQFEIDGSFGLQSGRTSAMGISDDGDILFGKNDGGRFRFKNLQGEVIYPRLIRASKGNYVLSDYAVTVYPKHMKILSDQIRYDVRKTFNS